MEQEENRKYTQYFEERPHGLLTICNSSYRIVCPHKRLATGLPLEWETRGRRRSNNMGGGGRGINRRGQN
jgi:hypothetical protein